MSVMVSVESLGVEELRQLVLLMQQRIIVQSAQIEMDQIEIDTLRAENTAVKQVLAQRIVALLVHPTRTTSTVGELAQEAEGAENGEETEAKPVIVDDKDKDKFQA